MSVNSFLAVPRFIIINNFSNTCEIALIKDWSPVPKVIHDVCLTMYPLGRSGNGKTNIGHEVSGQRRFYLCSLRGARPRMSRLNSTLGGTESLTEFFIVSVGSSLPLSPLPYFLSSFSSRAT